MLATAVPIAPGEAKAERRAAPPASTLDLLRPPDTVTAFTESGQRPFTQGATGHWKADDIVVTTLPDGDVWQVRLQAPQSAVKRLHLRWHLPLEVIRLVMGDAWERAYGDLEWRGMVPDRVLPWYFAAWDGRRTHCFGVQTGVAAGALCFWMIDGEGISLWADVRSGGRGLRLGERVLDVCRIVQRPGRDRESAFAALQAFCHQMCPNPRLPRQPLYGANNWYYAYGNTSATQCLDDARRIVSLSPKGHANRPFSVLDDGWQTGGTGSGVWDHGNEKFPDMPGLAAAIRQAGARPGIWFRPLAAAPDVVDGWRFSRDRHCLDPTVPDALQKIAADVARFRTWGFELVKHDFSTADLFGRWGPAMGGSITDDNWTFAEGQGRTTAEVIVAFYRAIREAAGDTYVLGCNTISHLSAGVFEAARVGDDTSGHEWSRTRKMGVNSLAFRAAQHNAFYAVDADCVGITHDIPWSLNRQWLDLLARSGTATFVSPSPDAVGPDQERDLRAALALAADPQPTGEPLDWQQTVYPTRWRLMGREATYDWIGPEGVAPF